MVVDDTTKVAVNLEGVTSALFFDTARRLAEAMGIQDPVSSDEEVRALLDKYKTVEDPSALYGELHPEYTVALKEKQQIEKGMAEFPDDTQEAIRGTIESKIAEQQEIINAHETARETFIERIGGFSQLQDYMETIKGIDIGLGNMSGSNGHDAESDELYFPHLRKVALEALPIGEAQGAGINDIRARVNEVPRFSSVTTSVLRSSLAYLRRHGQANMSGHNLRARYYRADKTEQQSPVNVIAERYGIKYSSTLLGGKAISRRIFEIVESEGTASGPFIAERLKNDEFELGASARYRNINRFVEEGVFIKKGQHPRIFSLGENGLSKYRKSVAYEGIEYVMRQAEGTMRAEEIYIAVQPIVDVSIDKDNDLHPSLNRLVKRGKLLHESKRYSWNPEYKETDHAGQIDIDDSESGLTYQDGADGLPSAIRDKFNQTLVEYVSRSSNPILKAVAEVYLDDVLFHLRIDEQEGKVYFPDSVEDVSHIRTITEDELVLVCRKGIDVLMESMSIMEGNENEPILSSVTKQDLHYLLAREIFQPVFTKIYGPQFADGMITGPVNRPPSE